MPAQGVRKLPRGAKPGNAPPRLPAAKADRSSGRTCFAPCTQIITQRAGLGSHRPDGKAVPATSTINWGLAADPFARNSPARAVRLMVGHKYRASTPTKEDANVHDPLPTRRPAQPPSSSSPGSPTFGPGPLGRSFPEQRPIRTSRCIIRARLRADRHRGPRGGQSGNACITTGPIPTTFKLATHRLPTMFGGASGYNLHPDAAVERNDRRRCRQSFARGQRPQGDGYSLVCLGQPSGKALVGEGVSPPASKAIEARSGRQSVAETRVEGARGRPALGPFGLLGLCRGASAGPIPRRRRTKP